MDIQDTTDYLALIRQGEDLLVEIQQRIQEILYTSKQLTVPLDRNQMGILGTKIIKPLDDSLKSLGMMFKRVRLIEGIVIDMIQADGPQPTPEVGIFTRCIFFYQSSSRSMYRMLG